MGTTLTFHNYNFAHFDSSPATYLEASPINASSCLQVPKYLSRCLSHEYRSLARLQLESRPPSTTTPRKISQTTPFLPKQERKRPLKRPPQQPRYPRPRHLRWIPTTTSCLACPATKMLCKTRATMTMDPQMTLALTNQNQT